MNQVIITGNIVEEVGQPSIVEQNDTKKVGEITTNQIAVKRNYKDYATNKYGTDFIDVVFKGGTSKLFNKYYHKGQRVVISGTIQTILLPDKEGNKHKKTQIIVGTIEHALVPKKEDRDDTL